MRQILFATLLLSTRAMGGQLSPLFSSPAVITATTVDAANNLYVGGRVNPTTTQPLLSGIPTTPNAYLPNLPSCPSACTLNFVAKISSSGVLLFGTYLDRDAATQHLVSSIAVDSAGNVFVGGQFVSDAANVLNGFGFVEKLAADGTKLLGSYQVAGGVPATLAIAPSGDVFVAGQTRDNPQACGCSFMATAGAFQSAPQGLTDAFVIRLDAALSKPVYSTLVGGAGYDAALAIAVDAAGEAYITGWTLSPSMFPVTPGALSTPNSLFAVGSSFVVKLRADGSVPFFWAIYDFVTAGTRSSAPTLTVATAISLDGSGVYIAGISDTQFAAKLTPDGSTLIYQTSLPGLGSGPTVPAPTPTQESNFMINPTLGPLPQLLQIAPDSAGDLLIMGPTDVSIKVTPNAFAWCSPVLVGSRFLIELDATGSVSYESYVTGGLAIRGDGEVWFADSSGAVHTFNANDPLPPSVRCIGDAFTGLSGPIAPGKLVTLMGPGIGPDVPATEQIDATGKVAVGLNGVNVYFNGIAAPLLSASSTQIEAVVPFENLDPVEFPTSTVAILKNGVEIDSPPVPVVAVAPVLLADAQGCISGFNSDGTLNNAANPAALGSFIVIFGEGAGLMNPAITGGIGNGQSQIVAPVTAVLVDPTPPSIFGADGPGPIQSQPAASLYAGDTPGFVEGIFQLDLLLPSSFRIGQERLSVHIGSSILTPCVWVKPAN